MATKITKPTMTAAKHVARQSRARHGRGPTIFEKLGSDYGLNGPMLARMFGVTEATLARWKNGNGVPANQRKTQKIEKLLRGLAHVMKKNFIATWLASPNPDCAGRTPLDTIARRDYDTIEEIIYRLEAGEPF